MASISGPTGRPGKQVYKVTITRTKAEYRETKSFSTLKAAQAWGKKREKEVDAAIMEGRPVTKQKNEGVTLADAIDKYVNESVKEIGKTKAQCLRTIRDECKIAKMRCDRITSKDIAVFADEIRTRNGQANSPSTVGNYLSHLQAVFAVAQPLWGIPLDREAMADAITSLRRIGTIKKSNSRARRPSLDELDKLLTHFQAISKRRPSSVPMVKIIPFAIFSTRRQDEIARITWKDFDSKNKRIMVRDMKHPGDKQGNDQWCDLPHPCPEIIESMPKISERIFPYSTDAISAAFTRACKVLAIEDLTFHDLRHEGASHLVDQGFTIPQVAAVTGHRSWNSLKRYTNETRLVTTDKYAGWVWIDEATKRQAARMKSGK